VLAFGDSMAARMETERAAGGPSAPAWVMSPDANGLVRQMRLFHLPTAVRACRCGSC
jgi:hypothetical protein